MYPLLKESEQLYCELREVMATLIEQFAEKENADCERVHAPLLPSCQADGGARHVSVWCKVSPGVEKAKQRRGRSVRFFFPCPVRPCAQGKWRNGRGKSGREFRFSTFLSFKPTKWHSSDLHIFHNGKTAKPYCGMSK